MSSGQLILASRSPQRSAILTQLGIPFEVRPSDAEELAEGPPDEVTAENAYRKANAVAKEASGSLILGVDTVVALGGRLYGKPADAREAEATLRALAGRTHLVLSAVCLIDGDRIRAAVSTTRVTFRPFNDELLAWYLATREWESRAGSYAIQGRGTALVQGVEGDFFGVVGLPVSTLLELAPELLPGE